MHPGTIARLRQELSVFPSQSRSEGGRTLPASYFYKNTTPYTEKTIRGMERAAEKLGLYLEVLEENGRMRIDVRAPNGRLVARELVFEYDDKETNKSVLASETRVYTSAGGLDFHSLRIQKRLSDRVRKLAGDGQNGYDFFLLGFERLIPEMRTPEGCIKVLEYLDRYRVSGDNRDPVLDALLQECYDVVRGEAEGFACVHDECMSRIDSLLGEVLEGLEIIPEYGRKSPTYKKMETARFHIRKLTDTDSPKKKLYHLELFKKRVGEAQFFPECDGTYYESIKSELLSLADKAECIIKIFGVLEERRTGSSDYSPEKPL